MKSKIVHLSHAGVILSIIDIIRIYGWDQPTALRGDDVFLLKQLRQVKSSQLAEFCEKKNIAESFMHNQRMEHEMTT